MSFEFQLVLTERCNLACKYCYIDQKAEDMTFNIFEQHYKNALPELMSRYGKLEYHAALFGGEPLLNWSLIEKIIPILKNDPKCKMIIAMTNGLEFKNKYKRDYFQKNNIAISLSFDGLWNKDNRPYHNGKSSFDAYLEEPLKSYFKDSKSSKVMISPDCIDTMVDNYKWFVEEFDKPMPDYSLVRDDIWSDNDVEKFEIEARKLADQFIQYINQGIRTSIGFFQLYILDLLFGKIQGKRPFGCFAGCGGAGFMPDGKVYPCARFGSINKYPIYDSIKNEAFVALSRINNPKLTNPKEYDQCKSCTLYNYCNAGCTFEQLNCDNNGNLYAEPVGNVCKILKILYAESIRITNILKDNELFKDIVKGSIKNVG